MKKIIVPILSALLLVGCTTTKTTTTTNPDGTTNTVIVKRHEIKFFIGEISRIDNGVDVLGIAGFGEI